MHRLLRRLDHEGGKWSRLGPSENPTVRLGIVVDDLAAATAFFLELGLKLQGEGPVEGGWVDRVVGLKGVRMKVCG